MFVTGYKNVPADKVTTKYHFPPVVWSLFLVMLSCPNNLNTGEGDINICQCLSCVFSYTFFLSECWTATSSENTWSKPFSSVKQKHKMSICNSWGQKSLKMHFNVFSSMFSYVQILFVWFCLAPLKHSPLPGPKPFSAGYRLC